MNVFKTLKNLLCRICRRLKVYCKHLYWTPERIDKNAEKIVSVILKKRPVGSVIIYTGKCIGDVAYLMAFVEEYKVQNPDRKIIILVPSKFAKTLAMTYSGYDRVVLLTKQQNDRFDKVPFSKKWSLIGEENSIFIPHPFFPKKTTMMDRLRFQLFKVGDCAPIHYHQLEPRKVDCIPNFYENCKKIIVLNPYSYSSRISKENFVYFEKLAQHLLNYTGGGYTIYTNVVKDQLPIRGTKELRCGFPELMEIANHIPCIISVRSGVLDISVKSGVNMFVVYVNELISPRQFSLNDWNAKGIVEEIGFNEFIKDENFDRVDDFLRRIAADDTRKETL